jgi:cytochrome c oxidase assembly protein subunit 15
VIVVMTSRWWSEQMRSAECGVRNEIGVSLPRLPQRYWALTALIFLQLVIGAAMRHQHAGLAIPDFPLAYGKLWPAMDAHSVTLYNSLRMENTTANPITAFQVALQMVHRLMAVIIFIWIASSAWKAARRFGSNSAFTRWNLAWLGLVLVQASLGAATIWSDKAADIATAHVVVGALLLANGATLCLIFPRNMLADESYSFVSSAAHPGREHGETVETVKNVSGSADTPLKRGVNENTPLQALGR